MHTCNFVSDARSQPCCKVERSGFTPEVRRNVSVMNSLFLSVGYEAHETRNSNAIQVATNLTTLAFGAFLRPDPHFDDGH